MSELKSVQKILLSSTALIGTGLIPTTALATDCTAHVIGSTLAGVICDFNSKTGSSVTIETGATLGGLNLSSPYTPTPPSFIINNGTISSSSTATGISIDRSSVTNGVT